MDNPLLEYACYLAYCVVFMWVLVMVLHRWVPKPNTKQNKTTQ